MGMESSQNARSLEHCVTYSNKIMKLEALWCQAPVSGNVAHLKSFLSFFFSLFLLDISLYTFQMLSRKFPIASHRPAALPPPPPGGGGGGGAGGGGGGPGIGGFGDSV